MDSVYEKAIAEFNTGKQSSKLLIHNSYGEPDEMPLIHYFRKESELTDLELYALELCTGKVLDVGAGTGVFSKILQARGVEVVALEISKACCSIMSKEGLRGVLNEDFFSRQVSSQFDTLLMMMNGFGLCGSMALLPKFFSAIEAHLAPGGQVIFDSSDLSYLYDENLPDDRYYGEMDYRYEYDNEFGKWFKWLYIDSATLSLEAKKYGFMLQVLFTEETGQYLGRLIRINA